jgi:hypothetical protein
MIMEILQIILFALALYRTMLHFTAVLTGINPSNTITTDTIATSSRGVVYCSLLWVMYYITFYI